MMDIRPMGIALVSIVLGATGQFLFRYGMIRYGEVTVIGIWKQLGQVIFSPAILAGFICFGMSSILWLVVISRWQLSFAYPFVALGYILVIFYGTVFLQEAVSWGKIAGCALILAGIAILGGFGRFD